MAGGGPEHRRSGTREIGWPRVAASFEFRRPLRFEDEFDVHLRIAEKTGKTIRYAAELRKDGEVLAIGSLTIICVRRRPGRAGARDRHSARHRRPLRGGARGRGRSAQHEGLVTRPCSRWSLIFSFAR